MELYKLETKPPYASLVPKLDQLLKTPTVISHIVISLNTIEMSLCLNHHIFPTMLYISSYWPKLNLYLPKYHDMSKVPSTSNLAPTIKRNFIGAMLISILLWPCMNEKLYRSYLPEWFQNIGILSYSRSFTMAYISCHREQMLGEQPRWIIHIMINAIWSLHM